VSLARRFPLGCLAWILSGGWETTFEIFKTFSMFDPEAQWIAVELKHNVVPTLQTQTLSYVFRNGDLSLTCQSGSEHTQFPYHIA
jgi:hypothetical protein